MNKTFTGKVLALFLLSIVLSFSIGVYAYATYYGLSYTTVIDQGNGIQAYNYIIFTDSSSYFARNGLTGGIISEGDFYTVLNYALLNIPTSGGAIFIKSGNYTLNLTTNLKIKDNTVLIGEKQNTIINVISTTANVFVSYSAPAHNIVIENLVFKMFNSANQLCYFSGYGDHITLDHVSVIKGALAYLTCRNVTVQNCFVSGTPASVEALQIRGSNIKILYNEFRNIGHRAIYVVYEGHESIITGNKLNNITLGGITVISDFSHVGTNLIVISDNIMNRTWGVVGAIEIAGSPFPEVPYDLYASITGNVITGCSFGINIERANFVTCTGNTLNNVHYPTGTPNQTRDSYGIKNFGQSNTISGNIISDCTNGIWIPFGENSTISNNVISDVDRMGILVSHDYYFRYFQGSCIFLGNRIYDAVTGINITSSYCTYNTVIGCDTRFCTNGIIDAGMDTKINLCWNVTSWIA